jgi:hypothetical protein
LDYEYQQKLREQNSYNRPQGINNAPQPLERPSHAAEFYFVPSESIKESLYIDFVCYILWPFFCLFSR